MLIEPKYNPIIAETYPVGQFLFYPNFVVGKFNEGAHVTKENMAGAIRLAQEIYSADCPIVYISHRLHSYSMDPTGYQEVAKLFPNFKGFAIVSKNRYRRMLAKLERRFIKKPMAVFYDLDTAFEWADGLLNNED